MGAVDLYLEHRRNEKVQKHLRIKSKQGVFLIGSSPEADLRIGGDGIVGCHAVLRFRSPHWYVCDVSGTESLKVDNQLVSEAQIQSTSSIEIAGHRFHLLVKEREADPFKADGPKVGELKAHQVVVKSRGKIVESRLLGLNESYRFIDGDTERALPAPKSGDWTRTEVGPRIVEQRLVGHQEIVEAEKLEMDSELKRALMTAFFFFMILGGLMAMLSVKGEQKAEVALDKKSMDIIFNAKAVKQKRAESQKVVRTAKGRAGGSPEMAKSSVAQSMPDQSSAPKVSAKATAALTSLRQSGLSSLVGKIAKRANSQGLMVAASGVSADKPGSGRAIFSQGTSTTGGGGAAAKEGSSYRLGGVGTQGKAGGAGNFREGTGLAGGSVGTGNLIAMVDEETVIEGGLDRDVIAEVIKRNLGQIRYCYERQLSSNPDLYGKLLVKFTITASGEVVESRVDNSTLKSPMVEGCILRRMASWKFPLPKGGTEVRVAYPFLFKAQD